LDSDSLEVFTALLVGVWSVDKPVGSEPFKEAPVDFDLDGFILFGFDW
jgi:hypothetical protein